MLKDILTDEQIKYADEYFKNIGRIKKSDSKIITERYEISEEEFRDYYKYYLTKTKNIKLLEENSKSYGSGFPSIDRPWEKYYSKKVLDFEVPKNTMWKVIYDNNVNNPDRVAINYFGRNITFGEMFKNIDETAKALSAQNVKKGDIVTVCMPTTPETIYLIYAASKLGVILNMVDPRTSVEGINNYINEVHSDLLIVLEQFYSKVSNSIEKTSVNKIITISPSDSFNTPLLLAYKANEAVSGLFKKKEEPNKENTIDWKEFILQGKGKEIVESSNADDPVVIVHTGGTTGMPKGVLLSNDALNVIAYQYKISGMHLLPGQKFLNVMPPFIAYGVGCGVHMPFVIGMSTIPVPNFDPKKLDRLIKNNKPNHMAGVPSHCENVIKSKLLEKEDLSYLITFAVGGDGIDKKLEAQANEFLNKHNAPNNIVKGYGITEEASLAAACINDINKPGSVGIPLPQNVISIFEPGTNNELKIGEVGEICLNVKSTMIGYYNNQSATDEILHTHDDGKVWVHTGDLGYMDKDGFLFVEGRIKRMIIRHDGFKVFPLFIENVILSHEAVKSCAVVGIPDTGHYQGKVPVAHIILKDEYMHLQSQIEEELINLCHKSLPEYVWPTKLIFKESFPYTPIGKLDFMELERESNQEKSTNIKLKLA